MKTSQNRCLSAYCLSNRLWKNLSIVSVDCVVVNPDDVCVIRAFALPGYLCVTQFDSEFTETSFDGEIVVHGGHVLIVRPSNFDDVSTIIELN